MKIHSIPFRRKIVIARRTMGSGRGPRFASLFVTRKCNLACAYCRSIRQPYQDIPLAQWEAIIDRLHSWGVRIFSLTGGEPILRPDIIQIIERITVKNKSVCWMISNFKEMTERLIDRFNEAGMQFITCSLDSLQGGKEGKSSSATLDLLSYAKSKGIIASTLTVVTRKNLSEIPDILETVTSRGIIFDMGLYQHVGGQFSPPGTDLKVTDNDALEKLRALLRRHKMRRGLVSPSWTYLNEDLAMYEKSNWKCSPSRDAYCVVNNDGNLMTCQEYAEAFPVLDLADLSDPRWREAKERRVKECKGCFYGCYYQKSVIRSIDLLFDTYTMLRV
jgi:MoaA/NifB/PqqE/SkfB family radical SAM enzyme